LTGRVEAQTLSEYMDRLRAAVEDALEHCLPSGNSCPPRLAEAMRYAVFPGGKRIRPVLTLAACEACGGRIEAALPAACAVELIHCYSLVHDDLPAMDDDDLRRGKPTCHKVYGEGLAILVGDALLTLAFEVLASGCRDPELAAESCRLLAEAAGYAGMVGGQADDIELAGKWRPEDEGALEALESLHRRKTGALIRASVVLGALAANAESSKRRALEQYANNLGLLFQLTDDLLDVVGRPAEAGKRVGKDIEQGKLTYPAVVGLDECRRRAVELHRRAAASLEPLGPAAQRLIELATLVLERRS